MSRLTSVVEDWICINPEDNDCPTMHYCECCDIPVRNCLYFSNAIAKLKEYEDLDEQGLLVKLPCKIGDTVYEIANDKIISFSFKEQWRIARYVEAGIFGKIAFLTKEEAEKALKEMERLNECNRYDWLKIW